MSEFTSWPFFLILVNLPKGLSILFIFSNNQLFVSLIHCIILLVSNLLTSALIFTISFCLFFFRLAYSCFTKSLRCMIIWGLSNFLTWVLMAINFPVKTAFPVSHRFLYVVSSFSFISKNFFHFS
jgi:hypothetical protein